MQFSFSQEKFFFQILWLQNVIHSYLFLEILLSRQSYFHDFLEEEGGLKSMVSALNLGGDGMELIWCKQYNFLFSMATSTRLSFIFKDICLFVLVDITFLGVVYFLYNFISHFKSCCQISSYDFLKTFFDTQRKSKWHFAREKLITHINYKHNIGFTSNNFFFSLLHQKRLKNILERHIHKTIIYIFWVV